MKIKNKIKHSLLTAAILLTVSGGSAYAMPTGGNVTMGNVTNVANPAEIMTANANSIINWDSFSVGVGEKVTFDTQKFMVLNRVIGGQESQILGMLSDQGQGKLLLINPAGIVLGENSVINANDLVLSTLRLDDDEFKALANGDRGVFEDTYDDKGKIEIKSRTNLTLNEALRLYGGKITIADGVEIISKDNNDVKTEILAGVRVETDLKGTLRTVYDANTNVDIGSVKIGTEEHPISNIEIRGDKIDLDNTKIIVDSKNIGRHNIFIAGSKSSVFGSKLLNKNGDIILVDRNNWSAEYNNDGSLKTFYLEADPDNEINIVNSNINTMRAKDITILGGNVTLDHSQLNSGKDIFVGAVKTYDSKEGVRTATTYENSVINADKDTVVHALGHAEAYGANLNIQAQRFDNVIDSTNPIVKYIGKDGVSLWELAPYIDTERDMNLDYYYNNLNGKTLGELIMMQLDNRKKGIIDKKLDATVEYLQKKLKEQEKSKGEKSPEKKNDDKKPDNYVGPNNKIDEPIYSGKMYIDGIQTSDVDENGNITVSFNIYSKTPVPGVVEIYDETGKIIDRKWIEGYKSHAESVYEALEDFFKLGKDAVEGNALTYKSEALSEVNKFNGQDSIVVPKGGKIRVTNNVYESSALNLYTTVRQAVDEFLLTKDAVDLIKGKAITIDAKEYAGSIMTAILSKVKEEALDEFKDKMLEETVKNGIDASMAMKGLGIDIPSIMIDTLASTLGEVPKNGLESAVNALASITDPFKIQKGLFFGNAMLNKATYEKDRGVLLNSTPVELNF